MDEHTLENMTGKEETRENSDGNFSGCRTSSDASGAGPQDPKGNSSGYGQQNSGGYGPQSSDGHGAQGPNGYGPQGPDGYGCGPNSYGYGPNPYGYGPNPYGGIPTGPHGKRVGIGLAVASMACGIIAAAFFLTFVNIPLAVIAIVLGIVYLVNYEPVERGLAITGIVTGALSIVLLICSVIVIMTSPIIRSFSSHPPTQDEIIEEYNDAIEDYYRNMFGDGF